MIDLPLSRLAIACLRIIASKDQPMDPCDIVRIARAAGEHYLNVRQMHRLVSYGFAEWTMVGKYRGYLKATDAGRAAHARIISAGAAP